MSIGWPHQPIVARGVDENLSDGEHLLTDPGMSAAGSCNVCPRTRWVRCAPLRTFPGEHLDHGDEAHFMNIREAEGELMTKFACCRVASVTIVFEETWAFGTPLSNLQDRKDSFTCALVLVL